MQNKVLVIDNDEGTIQTISQLVNALNLESLVMHNWGKSLNFLEKEKLLAVFVNVEMSNVDLAELLRLFPQDGKDGNRVSVFYLYSKSFNRLYLAAKKFPHAGELKKPVKGEDIFRLLNAIINLEEFISYNEYQYRKRLNQFKLALSETVSLLQKLETYIE